MATKWPEPVRNSGKLLIWASASATAGWSVAQEWAVKEFNRATHTRKLALRHSNNESQDVFYSPLEPNGGDKPQDDYMKVPIKGGIRLPPIVLSAQTARRLRDVWQ
jgi:hypothetical protein